MTNILNQDVISADGEYAFETLDPATEVLLEWAIIGGSATVAPGYVDLTGAFAPALLADGSAPAFAPAGGVCRVLLPNSGTAAIKVQDSSGDLEMLVCQNLIRSAVA